MSFLDHIRAFASDARGRFALACLLLLCPAAVNGRQTTTPRAPHPAAAVPAQPRGASLPVIPPREVVTVVHRLSGWKLLVWMATSGPSMLELAELPTLADAHMKIVAGYVYADGRSVAARLPLAEVELEEFTEPPVSRHFFAPKGEGGGAEPEYQIVTSEGKRFEAKFVGLDSSTGLALLETGESLLPSAPTGDAGDTEDPTVGQRVRLYAPIPAVAPPAAQTAQNASGYVYLQIDRREGRLTQVVRAPSGRLASVVVSANVSPEWVGAVAANEVGEVVGIVSQSREGETRVLPLSAVREACERVLKLRGTAPQPWLGARGEAVAQAPLQFWVEKGWTPQAARPLIAKRQGVILTSVAQGTPAALAGLQAGDLVTGVGRRAVHSVEDLSMTLKEAGVGSIVDLTVWRARSSEPLKLSVELKGAKNPALATAEAERRAASARVSRLMVEIGELENELRNVTAPFVPSVEQEARAARIRARLGDLRPKLRSDRESLKAAEERAAAAGLFSFEAAPVLFGTQTLKRDEGFVTRRLKGFGLHAIGLSSRSATPLGAEGGLLIVAVRPESLAAAAGLLPGDVIETVNGSHQWRFELRRLADSTETPSLVFGLVRGGRRLSVNCPPAPASEPRR